jgi:hypothetical protein
MAYREDRTMEKLLAASLGLVAVLFAMGWATRERPADRPYVAILGGGFIYNYRVADVFYGFSARVLKPVPVGSILTATFEDPGGGPPITVETRVNARTTKYSLRTPTVRGVEAHKPYRVDIALYDWRRQEKLWSETKTYASRISDSIVPAQPLTIGPGYTPNPALTKG